MWVWGWCLMGENDMDAPYLMMIMMICMNACHFWFLSGVHVAVSMYAAYAYGMDMCILRWRRACVYECVYACVHVL